MRHLIIQYRKINCEELAKEYDQLVQRINLHEGFLITSLSKEVNMKAYNNLKSWRSSIVDGGEISFKKFKKIITPSKKSKKDFFDSFSIDPQMPDDERELFNLVKAYEKPLFFNLDFTKEINNIIGNNMKLNEFWRYSGKIRTKESEKIHTNNKEGITYETVFCEPEFILDEITKLFNFVNLKLKNNMTFTETFSLAIIFILEFNKIKPFHEGNGRTSRILFEKIFEQNNFSPLIFSSEKSAQNYKEALLKFDTQIYLSNYEKRHDYEQTIITFFNMYKTEHMELLNIINKLWK